MFLSSSEEEKKLQLNFFGRSKFFFEKKNEDLVPKFHLRWCHKHYENISDR